MKTLYLDCGMGAAGDMLTAAVYELLPDRAAFLEKMNGLALPGVRIEAQPATTCGIAGTHLSVLVDGAEEENHDHEHEHHHHAHEHAHSSPAHIGALIERLPLPQAVRTRAKAVYERIAAAEAAAHGCPVGEVHFHEVGALDAVCDVVGFCYALDLLAPERIVASPVHVGSGQVRCAHGIMPVPAPATALLLQAIPSYGGNIVGELCTPTGAALLAQVVTEFGALPLMTTQKIGYGVGSKTFPAANCVRAFWGETAQAGCGSILELTCNIDDMTPEGLAFACQRLLEQGALDCYTTPATLKKGRAGQVLTLLCAPARQEEMARNVLRETTSNGLRVRKCEKYFMPPQMETMQTVFGPIRVKCAEGWGAQHRKPEYEDVAAAARQAQLPFQQVWNRIMEEI